MKIAWWERQLKEKLNRHLVCQMIQVEFERDLEVEESKVAGMEEDVK